MTRLPRTSGLALLVVSLVAMTSCGSIEEPEVTMTGVDFAGISTEGLAFELLVDVRNPNSFGADIGALTYRVHLDNVEVASGTQDDPVSVPANSTVEVAVPFTIMWSGMDKGLRKLLDGEEHEWHLKGSVKLSRGALSKVFPFSEGGRYEAPEASDIKLDIEF